MQQPPFFDNVAEKSAQGSEMKKLLSCLLLLFAPLALSATLLEIGRFEEILPLVDSSTMVLIDLDNTLFESELMLGSAPWRTYFRNKMATLDIPEEQRKRMIDVTWDFLQEVVPVRSVDPASPLMIDQLREAGILVFGFTARAPREKEHTERQLRGLNVRFTPFSVPLGNEATFENGVIYCGEVGKADALALLLSYLQHFDSCCSPETILMVDDREEHLLTVEPIAEAFRVKYIGVRFSGADQRTQAFDPAVVEYQWCHLPLLLSDQVAREKSEEVRSSSQSS